MLFSIIPTPQTKSFKPQSKAGDLKTRLDWGEPALTIVDVRDRDSYNLSHIQGAIPMPMPTLPGRAMESLELERDIYVYGDTDEETAEAATQLREAGFKRVSELTGGLAAWKAVGYPLSAVSAVA
ncbi:MAG: rhodanese-like domain-containing protein [Limnospira sp.]